MPKYLFVYHGGENPKTDEEVAKVLDEWGEWMGGMGAAVIDGGNPVRYVHDRTSGWVRDQRRWIESRQRLRPVRGGGPG